MLSKMVLQAPDDNTASCASQYILFNSSTIVVNLHKKALPCWEWTHQVYCKVPPRLCWHGCCLHRRYGDSRSHSLTSKAFLAVTFHHTIHIRPPHFASEAIFHFHYPLVSSRTRLCKLTGTTIRMPLITNLTTTLISSRNNLYGLGAVDQSPVFQQRYTSVSSSSSLEALSISRVVIVCGVALTATIPSRVKAGMFVKRLRQSAIFWPEGT